MVPAYLNTLPISAMHLDGEGGCRHGLITRRADVVHDLAVFGDSPQIALTRCDREVEAAGLRRSVYSSSLRRLYRLRWTEARSGGRDYNESSTCTDPSAQRFGDLDLRVVSC